MLPTVRSPRYQNLGTVGYNSKVPWVTNFSTLGYTLSTVGNKISTMGNTNYHRGVHIQVPWVTLASTVGNMHNYRGLHNLSTVGDIFSTVGN